MIYLDYNGTTPVDPRVQRTVCDSLRDTLGNPSSRHHLPGQVAAESVERARGRVSAAVDASEKDIIFTSGATEAISLGVVGAMLARESSRPNLVVPATEHKAVLSAAEVAARLVRGEVRRVEVDRDGLVDLDHLRALIDDSVGLVAVMAANNETGVLMDPSVVSGLAHSVGAWFFTDATQTLGKSRFQFSRSGADMACLSSHKAYGPKGVGALLLTREVRRRLVPISPGGGQEGGLRGGTQNVAGIEGFGMAASIAADELDADVARTRSLTQRLAEGLDRLAAPLQILGSPIRLPNTLMLRFPGADAEAVMVRARDVAVSGGSACQSSAPSPSHVLLAMGLSRGAAEECFRVSVGRFTYPEQVDQAIESLAGAVADVRRFA